MIEFPLGTSPNRFHISTEMKQALIALEDGRTFQGEGFGAPGTTVGEVCFNTSMTGYQEVLTDPSYRGQIVTMTYPLIGNYGVNNSMVKADQPHVRGFVVSELSPVTSNWRANESLHDYLKKWNICGIQGIDTRASPNTSGSEGQCGPALAPKSGSREEAVSGR